MPDGLAKKFARVRRWKKHIHIQWRAALAAGKRNRVRLKFPKQHVHLRLVGRRRRYASFSPRAWARFIAVNVRLYRAANDLVLAPVNVIVLNRTAQHTDPLDLRWKNS